ncbi:MAG: hypothetical protein SNJ56_00210 [Termitinemataceae bacterium]
MAGKSKKTLARILILLLSVCVYLVIAARPIPREVSFETRWLMDISKEQEILDVLDSNQHVIPFLLNPRFGYVTPQGNLILLRTLQNGQKLSMNESWWSVFSAVPDNLRLTSTKNIPGISALQIQNPAGYPIFFDSQAFIIGKYQDSIQAVSSSGNTTWQFDTAAPITCLDYKAGHLVIGTLNGMISILNEEGKEIFSYQTGGSRIPVVYGVALSSDAKKVALVSGIDKQRFIVLEKSGASYKVLYHRFLSSNFRRPVLIRFLKKDTYITFEGNTELLSFNLPRKQLYSIPLSQPLLGISDLTNDMLLIVITGENGRNNLHILELPDRILVSSSFSAQQPFTTSHQDLFVLGSNELLLGIKINNK